MSFFVLSAQAIVIMMLVAWIISLIKTDASVVDVFWGMGFGLIAIIALINLSNPPMTITALYSLVILWSLRLTSHLGKRWMGEAEEDRRYRSMRRNAGPDQFWWKSLYIVFALQGALIMIISLPLTLLFSHSTIAAAPNWAWVCLALALLGLAIETISDIQLTAFRKTAQPNDILKAGLWSRSRHPNYFGDALFWWGIGFAVVAIAPELFWTLIAPATMHFFLVNISGAKLLENHLKKKSGYDAYMQETNRFIPKIF
jgi:steroid 5-alpha reductase family enzyme